MASRFAGGGRTWWLGHVWLALAIWSASVGSAGRPCIGEDVAVRVVPHPPPQHGVRHVSDMQEAPLRCSRA
eukprot:10221846-Alexandrium_andersonii.AAC.1